MAKAKYQFDDFLMTVPDGYKDFVSSVHELLLEAGYKPKLSVTKSTGFQLAYHQPKTKTTAGIVLIFFKRNETLILRIYGTNHAQYPETLQSLPQSLLGQIEDATDCVKFQNPDKCWKGCIGHEFHIGERLYQKCMIDCFEFTVDTPDLPDLQRLITAESKARLQNETKSIE